VRRLIAGRPSRTDNARAVPRPTRLDRNRLAISPARTDTTTILVLSMPTPIGRLRLAASARGLVRLELPSAHAEARMNLWLALHFPNAPRRSGVTPILRKAATELEAYFTGRLRAFSLPVELAGTPFQVAVWEQVARVPFGATSTYGDIARGVASPSAVRAVGGAQAANPIPIVIPCHRVIGADGALTGYGGGLAVKKWLLDHEEALALAAEPPARPPVRRASADPAVSGKPPTRRPPRPRA
jgi:methylated-DNA-[protein]-cysteine S-methyltransferase